MDEIRILHTGDTHLGYRQYHSDVRRKDFLNAFSNVVDDAIDMSVDAVVHAGDLFDSRNPTLDDILDAMGLFSRLKTAGIPLLAIVGNHESKQSTQWLDLYGSLGLVTRLGAEPYRLGDVAIYGIDSVAKTKIPLFDYSTFNGKGTDARYNLLVMHQLVKPFAFGEWDIKEVIDSIPFDIHAVLLGDNHKYEITKVDDVWVTYAGSTERNSTAEREPRSYNIVTIGKSGIEISKRTISTREFVFIPVALTEGSNALDDVFSAIKEYDLTDKVAFVELSGDVMSKMDLSEVERFLLSRGALVPGIKDLRTGVDTLADPSLNVSFSDPDDVVKEEIRKMNLTSGGLLLDDIIRDPHVVKTKVGDEAENKLGELLDKIDFSVSVPVESLSTPVPSVDVETDRSEEIPEIEVDNIGEESPVEVMVDHDVEETLPGKDVPDQHNAEVADTSDDAVSDVSVNEKEVHDTDNISGLEGDKEELPEKALDDLPEEKPSSEEEKKENGSVKPRQYNLGDYL
ncbi:metallophosphoesterase family protein [Methanolobus profundi]|uniref:DNA double-strand break repair protein Mre11 n=1 Tax=Methanolobus profundi TaxID=487685 RepID=A0A1I4SQU7_9EURY|nr:exonuclease SbcCD subunit D [Methanolobus profundi]SFM66898.1 DNA repair exonuclease SbcCD nuclease subunit [Methanolobus profundi]